MFSLLVDLKYNNVLSVLSFCDYVNQVVFDKDKYKVKCIKSEKTIIFPRNDDFYTIHTNKSSSMKCLNALINDMRLLHRSFGHFDMHTIKQIASMTYTTTNYIYNNT